LPVRARRDFVCRVLAVSLCDGSQTKLWDYAKRYTLADHFFHAVFGGSFLNHFWLICACTPPFENAPSVVKVGDDPSGPLRGLPDQVTPEGYAVNTLYPKLGPHPKDPRPPLDNFLPPISGIRTIGDELNEAKPKAVGLGIREDGTTL
jgi:hypothetical protein